MQVKDGHQGKNTLKTPICPAGTSSFHPHVTADRRYSDAMVTGDYVFWRKTTLQDIEHYGHQETRNGLLLLGAMAALGGRKPQEARFVAS